MEITFAFLSVPIVWEALSCGNAKQAKPTVPTCTIHVRRYDYACYFACVSKLKTLSVARRMEPLDEDFYSDGAEEEDFNVAAAPLAAPEPEEGETEVSG